MDISDQPAEHEPAYKKIYNPKSNRMIVINESVYRKLLCGGYIYWREERLLIPPLHELPISFFHLLSYLGYHIRKKFTSGG